MKGKHKKVGLAPGSVVFTGNRKVEKIQIHHLEYDLEHCSENVFDTHEAAVFKPSEDKVVDWYDTRGLHDTELIEALGKMFRVHPLVLEDVVDVHQRPKFEEYQDGIFITVRALAFDPAQQTMRTEQVAIYFHPGLVLTFQETDSDLFAAVRKRLHGASGRIRQRGADYLAYALIDSIVDHYYVVLDRVEEVIEQLEEDLLRNPENSIRSRIHHLKKELLQARKSVSPLREAIARFSKAENEMIDAGTSLFLRDLYDHTIQVIDMVESFRDVLNGLQDLHLSEISFRMNQVIQILTIITTIFVPLSFLAGLYGMNFENIPELHHEYGYFILLAVMVIIAGGLLLWFRKKKWL